MQYRKLKKTSDLAATRNPQEEPAELKLMKEPVSLSSVAENIELHSRRDAQSRTITNRTHSEEALRASESRYRRLFEAAQDGILILDAKTGLITDVNPFLVKLLNYSHDEFLGKALWQIGLFRDIDASKAAFLELQERGFVRYKDLPLQTRDGRSINVEFVSNVYEENGKKVVQCNVRDITKRLYAERSEQQLRQAQKMEAVGQLAGGVAHDFNNLLGVIIGYCDILERSELPKSACKMIVQIHNAGISAKELTKHLLAFSRRQVLQPVFLDLNVIVNHMDKILSRLIGDDIQLECVLASDSGTVKADPSQIEQVLMNLTVNARDAMPQGGKITIKTANVEIDEAYARQHPYISPGPYVMLTVTDTGIGMDKETQSHIFEPFFSTKQASKGTGLGLSTVFGIVKQSAGAINVYSEPGHGATFKVYFPRCQEAPAVVQPDEAAPLRGGTETILLVEDSIPLRELTQLVLQDCGYTVLSSGPAEAIRIAEQHHGPLPLMITDVVMPGLSGPALAKKLGAARPDTKVLYTSGYAADEILQHGGVSPDCAFLEKPFTRDALVRKVRELLDSLRQPSLQL
jgi:two-component system cell cycle sensor histidine kinase/response regulator CckA